MNTDSIDNLRTYFKANLKEEKNNIPINTYQYLDNQLSSLLDSSSWHEDDPLPNKKSFDCLLEGVKKFMLPEPSLALDNSGNFVVGYFTDDENKSEKERFFITFLPDKTVLIVGTDKNKSGNYTYTYTGSMDLPENILKKLRYMIGNTKTLKDIYFNLWDLNLLEKTSKNINMPIVNNNALVYEALQLKEQLSKFGNLSFPQKWYREWGDSRLPSTYVEARIKVDYLEKAEKP